MPAKPFVKWVGWKDKLLDTIDANIPTEFIFQSVTSVEYKNHTIMNRLLSVICIIMLTFPLSAQTADSQTHEMLQTIIEQTSVPRYKMYQTTNIYNLLKLDTRLGQVWMVQYSLSEADAIIAEVGKPVLNESSEKNGYNGRFELYSTENIYNFIMLDTYTGDMYQVQWNIYPDKRFVIDLQKQVHIDAYQRKEMEKKELEINQIRDDKKDDFEPNSQQDLE